MNDVVDTVLGQTVQTIEDGDSKRTIAYLGKNGPRSDDEEITVAHRFPHYPTNMVAEVETEEVEDGHRITRARRIDTSSPESVYGEWFDLSDLDASEV